MCLCSVTSVVSDSLWPYDCSLPGSSVHVILQASIWSGFPCPPPGNLPNPGIQQMSPALQADSLPLSHRGSPIHILFIWLFSCWVMFHSLWPHGLQHARLPCPSPSPEICSNSCPFNQWCHPTISSSVAPFSFCPQSFQH